ncbi:MAG: hypothetical protein U9N81_05400 [Bacillota bacterium]|nr:hypothetical protein [Bacillota bacterium]
MTDKNTVAKASTAIIFGTAAVWFGAHAGGGFATGNQTMNFFVKFGWYALFIPLIAMGLLGLCFRNGMIFARNNHTHDYKSFSKALFAPYDKIGSTLFEICYIVQTMLATSASIAGAAALLQQALGLPYGMGVLLMGITLLVLTIFGASLVRNASSILSIGIVVAVVLLVILGLNAGWSNLTHVVATKTTTAGLGAALWMGLLYAGFQSTLVAPVISVSEPIKLDSDVNKTAWIGIILNGVMLTITCIMLLGFFPASVNETLPTYYVCEQLGYSWLKILYSIVLLLALISTGVSMIFAIVNRFEIVWTSGSGIFENVVARRVVLCFGFMAVAMGISLFGLTAIVAKGYAYNGYLGILLIILPLTIVAPIKNKKFAGGGRNADDDVVA